jgi:hypothetical protein
LRKIKPIRIIYSHFTDRIHHALYVECRELLHAVVHRADIQDRDSGILLATLFGMVRV